MNIAIGIQARLGSTRFPRKVFAELQGKPILQHVIERCKRSCVDRIAVLTPDDEVAEAADQWGADGWVFPVQFYREDDVQSRYVHFAKVAELDWIIRVNADCPLIDPALIDRLVKMQHRAELDEDDYVAYCRQGDRKPAILTTQGLPEMVSVDYLRKCQEHVTWMCHTPAEVQWLLHPCNEHNTVDTPEDLARLERRLDKEATVQCMSG